MLKKLFLIPAVLGVAGLLWGSSTASAQHHGGGHPSGGHVSGAHVGGVHVGGVHVGGVHYGNYHYGNHRYGSYNRGYRYPGFVGAYYPWYYNSSPYYYDSYPNYSYYTPSVQYYAPPNPVAVAPSSFVSDAATIHVMVPDPQARVWFDGNLTSQTGMDRVFNTPPLGLGTTYGYQVRATWMQNGQEVTQERSIAVTPGHEFTVDFNQ
jgi:uncharacterized protein (TIGR03000 family)